MSATKSIFSYATIMPQADSSTAKAFYLHHANMDRMWWIWQMQDPASRVHGSNNIAGSNTFLNSPASANTTVEDWVNYGYAAGPPRQIKELMSTTGGPFCYVYE